MNEKEERQKETPILGQELTPQQIRIIIPQCCREGWPTCTHVPKRFRKTKGNVGL